MSRTLRRNKQYLIDQVVGSYEERTRDTWWLNYLYPGLTTDQAYERSVARFTRDHHSGHYGVPRWYRQLHGSHKVRRREKAHLHHCLKEDALDTHLPDSRCRDSFFYFW